MPKLSKLSDDQIEKITNKASKNKENKRQAVRKQYVEYLSKFQPGDWVSVDLEESESRITVKNRLSAAAKDLGWKLDFKRSRGSIQFEIVK